MSVYLFFIVSEYNSFQKKNIEKRHFVNYFDVSIVLDLTVGGPYTVCRVVGKKNLEVFFQCGGNSL